MFDVFARCVQVHCVHCLIIDWYICTVTLHLVKPKSFVILSFSVEFLKWYYDGPSVTVEELVVGVCTLMVSKDYHAGL